MARSRFVRPDETILPISEGQAITVKRQLNSGEQRAMFARMYLTGLDGSFHVNPLSTGLNMIVAYLIDWTITDDDGKVVKIRGLGPDDLIKVLDNLSPDDFSEIKDAIEKHDAAMRAQRDAEKNARDGEMKSPATSPSAADSTGVTSGSETLIPT